MLCNKEAELSCAKIMIGFSSRLLVEVMNGENKKTININTINQRAAANNLRADLLKCLAG